MTMTYCRGCKSDVHITHKDSDCPNNNADLRVPDELKASNVERQMQPGEGDE
jgi:hypothetical protein